MRRPCGGRGTSRRVGTSSPLMCIAPVPDLWSPMDVALRTSGPGGSVEMGFNAKREDAHRVGLQASCKLTDKRCP